MSEPMNTSLDASAMIFADAEEEVRKADKAVDDAREALTAAEVKANDARGSRRAAREMLLNAAARLHSKGGAHPPVLVGSAP
jgi:hypothetical protein